MAVKQALPNTNRALPIVVVIVLGLVYLIPKLNVPKPGQSGPGLPALAVFPFESYIADSTQTNLGAILQDLIITDLTGLHQYRILSSERLLEIQKALKRKPSGKMSPNLILDVARLAQANALVTGRVYTMGTKTVITSQLLRTTDGVVLNSHKIEGQDLYSLVDELAESIRGDLEPQRSSSRTISIPVAEKTSTSIPAYTDYLAGVHALNSSRYMEAIQYFDSALEKDPLFKKALFKKVIAQWWAESHGDIAEKATAHTLEAIRSGHLMLSNEEKFMVDGLSHLIQRRYKDAQQVYLDLVRLRPDEKEYWYNLGEAYFHSGGEELRALDALEHTLKLDPDFELAYIHILDILMQKKFYERGLEFTEQILNKNPMQPFALERRARFLTILGEFEEALDLLSRALISYPDNQSMKLQLAETHYFAGNYDKAVELCRSVLQSPLGKGDLYRCVDLLASTAMIRGTYLQGAHDILAVQSQVDSSWAQMLTLEAGYLAALGGHEKESREWLNLDNIDGTTSRELWMRKTLAEGFLAFLNHDTQAWARVRSEYQSRPFLEKSGDRIHFTAYMDCLESMMTGDYAAVIPVGETLLDQEFPGVFCRYFLAIAYWKTRKIEQALTLTNQMQNLSIDPTNYKFNYPRSYYLQALIYIDIGERAKAIQAYKNLEKIWHVADETSPEWQYVREQIQSKTTGAL